MADAAKLGTAGSADVESGHHDPKTKLHHSRESATHSGKDSKHVQITEPGSETSEPSTKRKLCCGFMASRELFEDNRPSYVKRSMIEVIIYVVFLGCLTFVAYGYRSAMAFNFNKLYSGFLFDKVFSDFSDDESWNLNTFRSIVKYSEYYTFLNMIKRFMLSSTNLLQQNVIIGSMQLRQIRVGNDTCIVHPDFAEHIPTCYASYSQYSESTETYGSMRMRFTYSSAAELGEVSYKGVLATYGGGGFNLTLPREPMALASLLLNLKFYKWIDRGTRAIFLDWVMYNANVNILFVVRLLAEFSPTSLVVTSTDFHIIRPFASDQVVDLMEYVIYAFMAFYVVHELIKIFNLGGVYWSMVWNYLDLAILVNCCCMILFKMFSHGEIHKQITAEALQVASATSSHNIDFREIATMQTTWENTLAVLVFLCWIKLFRYCNFTRTMSQAWLTLTECARDVVGLIIIFMIVFVGFSQFAYVVFGNHVKDFSTFGHSMMSLMKILVLHYDTSVLRQEVNSTLILVFFFPFVFFVYFIMVTMFIAVIIDTYRATSEASILHGREMEASDYIGQMFMKKPKFLQWNARMIRLGYENPDIRTIIKRHQGQVSDPLLEKAMALELDELSKSSQSAASKRGWQLEQLQRRVEQLQAQLSAVGVKLDYTIEQFKSVEFSKLRRKVVLEKLIDAVVEVEMQKEGKAHSHIGLAIKEELERLNFRSAD